MKVLKILLIGILTLFSLSFGKIFAQDEINVGGKAKCVLNGEVPIRKIVADGNRVLLIKQDNVTLGSFSLQLLKTTKKTLIDFNILALFGEVKDVDAFLSGAKHNFTSNESDFMVKVTFLKNDNVLDLSNELLDEQGALTGSIKIKKFENNLASGDLKFIFEGTSLKITTGERDIEDNDKNGKMVIRCKFKDVPIDIK
ncbi:MAG: hypothetical protein HYR97_01255 [Candidatus Melainabacteria bacterium]|nr:hypothetical protein [Candidatus Melainabacteria bacterium]MBI3308447.1 hypothetical protein [Candidatus Melainabacteria bacterium]